MRWRGGAQGSALGSAVARWRGGAVATQQQAGGWVASRGAHRVLDLAPVVARVAHREEDQLLGRRARLERRLEHARRLEVATRKGQRLRMRRRQRRGCCVAAAAREPLLAALRVGEGCGRRGDGIRQRCGPHKRRAMPLLCLSRRVVLGEHSGLHGPVAQLVDLRPRLSELHALQLQLVLQLAVVGHRRHDGRDRGVAHHNHDQRGGDGAGHAHAALLCREKRDLCEAGPQQRELPRVEALRGGCGSSPNLAKIARAGRSTPRCAHEAKGGSSSEGGHHSRSRTRGVLDETVAQSLSA